MALRWVKLRATLVGLLSPVAVQYFEDSVVSLLFSTLSLHCSSKCFFLLSKNLTEAVVKLRNNLLQDQRMGKTQA